MTDHERAEQLRDHRELWELVNERFTEADAAAKWQQDHISWGLFDIPDADLGVLGDVAGLDVVELGCGTAYFSAWLARGGARPVAVDLSHAQLTSAARRQEAGGSGPTFPLVEADGGVVPLRGASFDLVVSEYGAAPWCDPARWIPEAARVLRPGGRLVFLTNSVLLGLCVPAEGGYAGTELLRPTRALAPITWPGGGTEHHPTHGEWIRHLRAAGFVVDALHELHPPAGADTHEFYEIVTSDWAASWPAEDLWVAHLPSVGRPEVEPLSAARARPA